MAKRGHYAVLVAGIVLAVWMWLYGLGGAVSAQTKDGRASPVYHYVGVEQTIARVEAATGRVEVLCKRGEPKASLLTPDSRPWEWREISVQTRRQRESDRGDAGEEGAKASGGVGGDGSILAE